MKICPKCKETKTNLEFHKARIRPDGLASYCKLCKKQLDRNWIIKNRDKRNQYIKLKRLNDPLYKIEVNLRNRVYKSFVRISKSKPTNTNKILGANYSTIKKHIEKLFTKGMNWSNYGLWHIDHIIPLSSAQDEKELIKLFHHLNTQPLWAADNLKKSNSIQIKIEP